MGFIEGLTVSLINLSASVNRRMDEWVSLSRIDVKRGAVEEGPKEVDYMLDSLNGRERKVTRNLKRKHDEINHVQKVRYRLISFSLSSPLRPTHILSLSQPPLPPSKKNILSLLELCLIKHDMVFLYRATMRWTPQRQL